MYRCLGVDAVIELRDTINATVGIHGKVLDVIGKEFVLPTYVRTLSAVSIIVANSPISLTVPVTPPALDSVTNLEWPQDNENTPAAKFASKPLQRYANRHPGCGEQCGK